MAKRKKKTVKFDSDLAFINPEPEPELIFVPNRAEFPEFSKQDLAQSLQSLEGINVSFQNFRSTNSVTILALGISGDGITSTLDHLMGRQGTAGVGKQTDTIVEHTFDWPSSSLGIENSQVIFIDTPGFGHPEASSQYDLQCLKNIVKYFELKQYHPNFVLLIGNMAQPRIEKRKGRFVKFVKTVKETLENTVLDLINSNVMLVLTHLTECVPAVQKNPGELMKKVAETVAAALKIENKPPVVTVAENQVGLYNVKRIEDFFLLPNGQLYPKNVFEGMMTLAGKHDPVGFNIVHELSQEYFFLQSLEAKTKIFAFPGLSLVSCSYFFDSIPDPPEWLEYVKLRPLSLSQMQVHKSFSARRSTNSMTILVIGEAGVGKSSTINSMFGRQLAPIQDDSHQGTADIVEYTVEAPVRSLLMANAKVHIVDTPGLMHSSRDLAYDSKIFANIRSYFEAKGVFPNAILLLANITHPLLAPGVHPFQKLLRAIRAELSDVVLDTLRPNLLVVLTHLRSLPPLIQQDPTNLVMAVKKMVSTTLNIADVPIEIAENLFQELPFRPPDHFLPTKQWFPRNLFVRISFICLAGADPVGQLVINDIFPELPNKIVATKMFRLREIYGFSEVAEDLISSRRKTITEVEEALKACWMKLSLQEKIDCKLQLDNTLDLVTKSGFKARNQFLSSKRDLIRFYQALDPDPGMEKFVTKALGIEVPRFAFDPMVGTGYDLLRDTAKDFQIFSLGQSTFQKGLYLPEFVVSTFCPERKLIWLHSHSKHYLVRRRLSQLNIEFDQRVSRPNYSFRPGFNLIEDYETLSAVYDFHWMKLDLHEKVPLSPEFEELVKQLPKSYDKCHRRVWQEFISKVGVHYISTSYVGASIIFEIKNLNPDAVHRLDEHSYNADTFLNYLLALPRVLPPNSEDSNLKLIFAGGDETKAEELRGSRNNIEFFSRLKRWEYAIWENPVVSDLAVGLSEVAELVGKIDFKTGKALKSAIRDFKNFQDPTDCNQCAIE